MNGRDHTIDHLRGLAMLWVIVVHVLYWGGYNYGGVNANCVKSYFLFEMPLFFYVTGAGCSFSKVNGYFQFVYRRYRRILIPYWVFAFICAGLSILVCVLSGEADVLQAAKIMCSWFIPVNRQISYLPYLTSALWFLPVYLVVVLLLPFLMKMKASKKPMVYFVALVIIFVVTCVTHMGWIQYVAFYSIWTYIGLFYSHITAGLKQRLFRKRLCSIALSGVGALAALCMMGLSVDMQYNKFPPNLIFGLFSIVMMSLILLLSPQIHKIITNIQKNRLLKGVVYAFSMRSMTVYLYQVFVFGVTIRLSHELIPGSGVVESMIKSFMCLITTVPLCAAMAFVFGKVELVGTDGLRRGALAKSH